MSGTIRHYVTKEKKSNTSIGAKKGLEFTVKYFKINYIIDIKYLYI